MRTEYVNIKDIVRQIGQKFEVDPSKDWQSRLEINVRCNKCNDKKYHLGLSFAKDSYNCYRCPNKGPLHRFLKRNGIKFEVKGRIAVVEQESIKAPKLVPPKDREGYRDEMIANEAKAYLSARGFDVRFLKNNFKIWPITDTRNFYYGYIIIAVNEYAFYARKFLELTPDRQKHVIRKSDQEMKLFYAYEKNNSNTLLVVESMFNLMKAAQYGYDALCIFGKGKHAGLAEYLRSKPVNREICLCFDKDVTAEHIIHFVRQLQRSCGISQLSYIDPVYMPCKDIADMTSQSMLVNTVNKKKSIAELYLSEMLSAIGE